MWPNPQFPVDLVTFTEELLYGNFIFFVVTESHSVIMKIIRLIKQRSLLSTIIIVETLEM